MYASKVSSRRMALISAELMLHWLGLTTFRLTLLISWRCSRRCSWACSWGCGSPALSITSLSLALSITSLPLAYCSALRVVLEVVNGVALGVAAFFFSSLWSYIAVIISLGYVEVHRARRRKVLWGFIRPVGSSFWFVLFRAGGESKRQILFVSNA